MACVRHTGRVISPALSSSPPPPPAPLLPSPPCFYSSSSSFFSFRDFHFFFLRFSMRGLETRLINIAGVAAALFSRVPASQSAFTGHCTHDACMYYECRPFPPSLSLLSDVCIFRVENWHIEYGNAIFEIVTRVSP